MNIRRAQREDEQALFALSRSFATSFVVDTLRFSACFAELLASAEAHLLVAERDGQVVGYALAFDHRTFFANGRITWIEEIMVHESVRRCGVGRLLMQSIEAWAVQRDSAMIALATRRAAAFYEALGFEESATYYRKLLT